jgi:DNA-binding transcriptional LysR family regulator
MVEAGFGLALLPASSVDEELRAGTLRALRVPALRLTVPVVLIHRRRAYLSGAAQALAAMLTDWPASTPNQAGPGRRTPRSAARPRRRPGVRP